MNQGLAIFLAGLILSASVIYVFHGRDEGMAAQPQKYELLKDGKMGGYLVLNTETGDFCHYGFVLNIAGISQIGGSSDLYPGTMVVKDFCTSGHVASYQNGKAVIETFNFGQHP